MRINILVASGLESAGWVGGWAWFVVAWFQISLGLADEPASRFIAATPPLSPASQRALFHLPPGFEIELVAAEPQIRKPINLNFDAAGRLLVSGSVEYPRPAGDAPRDTITILSDSDHDGRYDKAEVLAAGLNIPVGVTTVSNGVLAYSIPNIIRYLDPHKKEHTRQSEVIFSGFDFADTHGMPNAFTRWLDGWIYACHGEGNTSTVAGADGHAITLRGGGTFRMQADGSRIEHFSFGQANPFGLCFDEWGDMFTADSHSRPASLVLRGATYPGLGQASDPLGFGPSIMAHYHGSTGIGGIAICATDQFPEPYRNALFLGNPVTGRINHDRLETRGSTYVAVAQPDFLTCDDPWFRPVDLKLGPDGALYIADFYNRIIAHSLVPLDHAERDRERGRIWRVIYRGEADQRRAIDPPPNLSTAPLKDLLANLGDGNLVVRTLATHELVDRIGSNAANAVRQLMIANDSNYLQRAHGIWVLHRLGALTDDMLARLANDAHPMARVQAMKVLAERADWSTDSDKLRRLVLAKLSDNHPLVCRAAADALSRHPTPANLEPLLALWAKTPSEDAMLVHVARMALRNSLQDNIAIREIAQRLPLEDQRRIADVCLGIATGEAADFLLAHWRAGSSDPQREAEQIYHITRYSKAESLPQLNALWLTYRQQDSPTQAKVLASIYRALKARAAEIPVEVSSWSDALANQLLGSVEEATVYQGLELTWELQLSPSGARLEQLAGPASPLPSLRAFAIDTLGAVAHVKAVPRLEQMLANASEAAEIREKAADALGKIDSETSRAALARQLSSAPAGLALAIARALAHSDLGIIRLLDGVRDGTASSRLLKDVLVEQGLRAASIDDLEARLKSLLAETPPVEDRLAERIHAHRDRFAKATPDLSRGATVYAKHCANCHQLTDRDQRIGPPLEGIGQRGLERILEDLLDPHRNVDVRFRSAILHLSSGRIVTGLVLREDGNSVVIADGAGKEMRVPASEIEDRRQSLLSPMPANWDRNIAPSDFDDLLGYLLSRRPRQDHH